MDHLHLQEACPLCSPASPLWARMSSFIRLSCSLPAHIGHTPWPLHRTGLMSWDFRCSCYASPWVRALSMAVPFPLGFTSVSHTAKGRRRSGRKTREGNIYQWQTQVNHYLKPDSLRLHLASEEASMRSTLLFHDDSRPDGVRASAGPKVAYFPKYNIDGPVWPAMYLGAHSSWLWLCAFKDAASMSCYVRSSNRQASQNMSKYA